jgi:hypothetical protein
MRCLLDTDIVSDLLRSPQGKVAQALADDLGKRFPEDTLVQFNYLPTLHGKLALNQGKSSETIESLRADAPYELGLSTQSPYNWTAMYPVFVRGEAYLAAHQGSDAVAEFQKILDHRGIVVNGPIGALAHLALARAYVLQRDSALGPKRHTRISSGSGKTQTPTFLSSCKPKRNTPSSSEPRVMSFAAFVA